MSDVLISKSAFIKAEQCLKHFYLYKKFPFLKDKISKEKQLIFQRGNHIGKVAQTLFPNGVDISASKQNMLEYAKRTLDEIKKGTETIYEATFIYNQLVVMVDILHKTTDGWIAYEVKSSIKISETYVKDACFQYYVVKHCLNNLINFNLITINNKYELVNEFNPSKYFKITSVLNDAIKNEVYFENQSHVALTTLSLNEAPNINIGLHCFQPYDCDFIGNCWKQIIHDNKFYEKEQLNKYNLLKALPNIELPVGYQLPKTKTIDETYNQSSVKQLILKIQEPVCSMDIEAWGPALPYYNGTTPFQQIPFLFSICYLNNNKLTHKHYLKPIQYDDRICFIATLIDYTAQFNTILVYDKTLELGILNQMINLFPDYKTEIEKIKIKFIDLYELLQQQHYDHPKLQGQSSLKAISNILSEQLSYDKLEIQSGLTAMYAYESLILEQNPIHQEIIKQQLIDYCNMDTVVTYEFYKYLSLL